MNEPNDIQSCEYWKMLQKHGITKDESMTSLDEESYVKEDSSPLIPEASQVVEGEYIKDKSTYYDSNLTSNDGEKSFYEFDKGSTKPKSKSVSFYHGGDDVIIYDAEIPAHVPYRKPRLTFWESFKKFFHLN